MADDNTDGRFRSRKWLLACFVLGFATLVVSILGITKLIICFAGGGTSTVMLMPVLWWWSATASGVLSLYGTTKALDAMANRGGKNDSISDNQDGRHGEFQMDP